MTAVNLETLIPVYAVNKAQADDLKKVCDRQNKEIKELMKEADTDKYEAGGYVATYSVSTREKFNEALALQIIRDDEQLSQKLIKTREYVDTDMLEKLIYTGSIEQTMLEKLQKCIDSTEVVTLRVTKKKEK